MKKALVLGVLAFFAINVASVQSASAQEKKAATTTVKKEAKPSEIKKEAKKTATTATTTTAAEKKTVKPAAATSSQAKACCKEEGKDECQDKTFKAAGPKVKSKQATPEIGVPPTPKSSVKKSTGNTTSNSNSGQR